MTIYLSTRDVANILGFRSTAGVIALIESGVLACARVRVAADGRHLYRPTVHELAAYLQQRDPALLPVLKERYPEAA